VTYDLPESAVDSVLACVATLSETPSSIVFDDVTRAFYEGDERGHGAAQLAEGWRNLGNAHRSGVANVQALLQPHGFVLREELDPAAMEQRFLSHLPGGPRKVWEVVRTPRVSFSTQRPPRQQLACRPERQAASATMYARPACRR
jgi:O-methyltransferase involved in polyketide biosynthesis